LRIKVGSQQWKCNCECCCRIYRWLLFNESKL